MQSAAVEALFNYKSFKVEYLLVEFVLGEKNKSLYVRHKVISFINKDISLNIFEEISLYKTNAWGRRDTTVYHWPCNTAFLKWFALCLKVVEN